MLDTVPVLAGLTVSGRGHQIVATFRLTTRASVTISAKRKGARKATKTVRGTLAAGRRSLRLRAKALRPGRYQLTITVRAPGRGTVTLHRTVTVRAAG
jgi:hypothetical protein